MKFHADVVSVLVSLRYAEPEPTPYMLDKFLGDQVRAL
jgi:hypothetical protein